MECHIDRQHTVHDEKFLPRLAVLTHMVILLEQRVNSSGFRSYIQSGVLDGSSGCERSCDSQNQRQDKEDRSGADAEQFHVHVGMWRCGNEREVRMGEEVKIRSLYQYECESLPLQPHNTSESRIPLVLSSTVEQPRPR